MSDVFSLEAKVSDGGTLDLYLHNNHAVGFARTRDAMVQIREELDRILRNGQTQCPFRNKSNQKAIVAGALPSPAPKKRQ